jgi:hypothetical protein
MPRVGFEPTIPVFEQAKTVHASDHAAAVTPASHGRLSFCGSLLRSLYT